MIPLAILWTILLAILLTIIWSIFWTLLQKSKKMTASLIRELLQNLCQNLCQNKLVTPNNSKIHKVLYQGTRKIATSSAHICKLLQNLCQLIVQCGWVYRGEALGIKVEFVGISAKIRFVHGYLNDVLKQEFWGSTISFGQKHHLLVA